MLLWLNGGAHIRDPTVAGLPGRHSAEGTAATFGSPLGLARSDPPRSGSHRLYRPVGGLSHATRHGPVATEGDCPGQLGVGALNGLPCAGEVAQRRSVIVQIVLLGSGR